MRSIIYALNLLLIGCSSFILTLNTAFAQGDSVYTQITSPVENATFEGPADINIQAVVHGVGSAYYFEISTPDNGWRKFKIGYNPSNLWSPSIDPTAGGHTHLQVVLKGISSGIDWSDLGIRPQGNSNNVRLDTYLPANWDETSWVTLSIPLADFGGVSFSNISLIEIPYSHGTGPFTLAIKEVVFTGGATDFVWFGRDKIDNSRDGVTSGTPPGGEMVATLEQESGSLSVSKVKFYANGALLGEDSTEPYSYDWTGVLSGNFALTAVSEFTDGSSSDLSETVNITVNSGASSSDVVLTSPTDGATYTTPATIPLAADVNTLEELNYFRVENPDNAVWRKFRLGHDPHNVWNPQIDPTVGGSNTHIEVTLRAVSSNILWEDIGIRPQGNSNPVRIGDYLPAGGIDTTWTTISIPLADFTGTTFNGISMIELPYSNGAGYFSFDFKEVKFTGGSEFIWFGGSKIDNSNDGVLFGGTLNGSQMYGQLYQQSALSASQVVFYENGIAIGTDDTEPFEYQQTGLVAGNYQYMAVAQYNDGSQKVSAPISVTVNAENDPFDVFDGEELFGPGISRQHSRMHVDPNTGNVVLAWTQYNNTSGNADIYFAILDQNYQPIAVPAGHTEWPIKVHTDQLLMDADQTSMSLDVHPTNGNIAIAWMALDIVEGEAYAYHRVFNASGDPLAAYATSELLLNDQNTYPWALFLEIAWADNNQLAYAVQFHQDAVGGSPIRMNKINVATGQNVLANDATQAWTTEEWPFIRRLEWDSQTGFVLTYSQGLSPFQSGLQFWTTDLSNHSGFILIDDPVLNNAGLDISISNGRVLASWLVYHYIQGTSNLEKTELKAQIFEVNNLQLDPLMDASLLDSFLGSQYPRYSIHNTFPDGQDKLAISYALHEAGTTSFYANSYEFQENGANGSLIPIQGPVLVYEEDQSAWTNLYRYVHKKLDYSPQSGQVVIGIERMFDIVSANNFKEDFGVKSMDLFVPGAPIICETPPTGLPDPAGFSHPSFSNTQNRIITRVPRVATTDLNSVAPVDMVSQVGYFDGLGRPTQQIDVQSSPTGADIVSFQQYDQYGRSPVSHLPFTASGNGGGFISSPEGSQVSFYDNANFIDGNNLGSNAKAVSIFEASPLNRVLEQGAPGADWQPGGATIKTTYLTVGDPGIPGNLLVPYFGLDPQIGSTGETTTYSTSGSISIIKTEDENGALSFVFTDKLGRTLMQSSQIDITGDYASTLYVYDQFGQVKFVIQPEGYDAISGSWNLSSTVMNDFAFQYTYDERRRVIEKKVPGADWVYLVYDELDRVVATQDGNLRSSGQWLVTKYDVFGRPALTGIVSGGDRNSMQGTVNGNGTLHVSINGDSYNQNGVEPIIPTADIHSTTYYDNYEFLGDNTTHAFGVSIAAGSKFSGSANTKHNEVKGQVTGIKIKVLDPDPDMPDDLLTVTYYDIYGREIQTRATNHFDEVDVVTNRYNFAGEMLESVVEHSKNAATEIIHKVYEYDHRGRLLRLSQQLNNDPAMILSENLYNELGELAEKNLGASCAGGYLQSVDYQYNLRGWMTRINQLGTTGPGMGSNDSQADLFGMSLGYNATAASATPLYNGNISHISWQSFNDADSVHGYNYSYDKLNRLTAANYTHIASLTGSATGQGNRYNTSYTYHKNGNIETLSRAGMGASGNWVSNMDDLSYNYGGSGNQLQSISENGFQGEEMGLNHFQGAGGSYNYDDNGNMTTDANRNMDISYNHLNKPTEADFNDGTKITWKYSADGTKLRQKTVTTTATIIHDYVNAFFYVDDALEQVQHEEGRVLIAGNTSRYDFNLTDHLGNVRLSFSDIDGDGTINPNAAESEVLQTDHYYPFGLRMAQVSNFSGVENRYRYNGKEFHSELDLGWYDYGARMYDPSVARWNGMDPLAEKYGAWSTYNYVLNNPINYIDPDGMVVDGDEKGMEIYENHKERISSTLKAVAEILKMENLSEADKKLFSTIQSEFQNAQSELKELEDSDVLYFINTSMSQDELGAAGRTSYDLNSIESDQERVEIFVANNLESSKNEFRSIADELQHAYQYETRELSFTPNNLWLDRYAYGGTLHDLTDERAAAWRGIIIRGGTDVSSGENVNTLNDFKRELDHNLAGYTHLHNRTSPRGKNSTGGVYGSNFARVPSAIEVMRNYNQRRAASGNRIPFEIYRGWKKDLNK